MAKKVPARGAVLAAGCMMFLFTGIIYAWSILSAPFGEEFGWNSAQLGLNFTLVMSCFCIGGLVGSFVTRRISARVTVWVGGIMCALGYLLCSRIRADILWLLYLSYGVLIGLGVGCSYNAILGTVVGWFPEKKGFASGVLLMGFGLSTLIMGNAADLLFRTALGWRNTYLLLGGVTLLVLLLGGRFMAAPPPREAAADAASGHWDHSPGAMLRTGTFWLLFAIIVCSNLIGTGVIGHSRYLAQETGILAASAPLVVGLQSVCNGVGRLAVGALFDRCGRTAAMITDTCCFAASCGLLILALQNASPVLAVAGLLLVGFSYGGMPTLTSSVTADCFGDRYYSFNFSIANMSMLPASFGSTIVGCIQTASGSYYTACLLLLADAAVVIVLDLLFRRSSTRLSRQ